MNPWVWAEAAATVVEFALKVWAWLQAQILQAQRLKNQEDHAALESAKTDEEVYDAANHLASDHRDLLK